MENSKTYSYSIVENNGKKYFKKELNLVVDWSKVDKTDYVLAMERSPIKDVEIKELLKQSLTNKVEDREVYMKGIDNSYMYEGYLLFRTEEL